LSELAKSSQRDNVELTEELLKDEKLQKAAVAVLMEQSDTKSWKLTQQVSNNFSLTFATI